MKVLVPIKRVVDYNIKVRPNAEGTDVDLSNLKMAINPFCEIAVEEAVRLKESGHVDEIIVVSVGESKSQEQLRAAMAIGADRGILIEVNEAVEPLGIAKLLHAVVKDEQPDLVVLGKQSIDGDNNQTGQMLAQLAGYPQATFASEVKVNADSTLSVTREIDGGLETLKMPLPAIVTTDLRLNEPRYAKLPNIMKAKKKPLDIKTPDDFGVDVRPRLTLIGIEAPPTRKGGIKVESVDELVDKLKNEARVLS